MSFISVGIDHENAPLDLLERATVVEENWGKVLRELLINSNINEAVFVSTCLRTEVYASIELFHGAVDEIVATLSHVTGVATSDFQPYLTIHFDRGVPAHLFAVAAGLKSVVPGEHEVLGQLRRALERADEEHAVGPELADLFRRSLSTGRRVRNETMIARGTTSFAHAAVTLAMEELGDLATGATAVVVGAGQLASGIVKSLRDHPQKLGAISVVNRTHDAAVGLVNECADERITTVAWSELARTVRTAHLVVTAIESTNAVISAADFSSDARVVIVDLGMPRVVNHDVDALSGVRRLDISDLRSVVDKTLAERHAVWDEAQAIVTDEVNKFTHDLRSRGAATIVSELRDYLEELRVRELERRQGDLSDLTPDQLARVESLTKSLVAKIAHQPTVALKEATGSDRGQRLTESTRHLFDL
jgi:glutamyl-tRNA reductase